jgi:DNA mismatch repair protein MutL
MVLKRIGGIIRDNPVDYNTLMNIHVLLPEVASQIAAGEVVERPASVVKELLENSLDAGARHITIQVNGAGRQLIEVADDGCGIPADQVLLAVARHATSKLQSADDLFHIATLGFRGEALASIGSVTRMTVISRADGSEKAVQMIVEGGQTGRIEPVGAPVGTVIRVQDLFFNVPARLKFLKSDATERRNIDELVTRYALAYPFVRIHLFQDGRPSLMTSGNGDRREVLATLYGVENAKQMLEVLSEEDGLCVTGYISPISLTRSNRREITFFVNGRPVHDQALSAALVQAYHTMLMVGRYPIAVLFIELQPDVVDVNVHPAKAEVRFRDADAVFRGVQRAVRRALLASTPVPGLTGALTWSQSASTFDPTIVSRPGMDWQLAGNMPEQMESAPGESALSGALAPQYQHQAVLSGSRIPLLRLVGQIALSYLVAEGPDGLYLIDQHAAHERVLFERFVILHQNNRQSIPMQTLLEPVLVELPPASARLVEEQLPVLAHLGFAVELFGQGAFLVRAIPALLSGLNPAAALAVLVEDFEEDESPLQTEQEARIIARVCKRAAVKAGQVLSQDEQQVLLRDLEACASPRTCPHGRPTMIHLSVDLLERQFGRRGAR